MAVKITKPEINVREKLSELDKPSGIAGEAMLRAETPQEQFNLIGAGRRNLIINGDMAVWQRGTSFTSYNQWTADRWRFSVSAVPTSNSITLSQENITNFLRWQCTMGSGEHGFLHHKIEGNPLAGKTATLSFKAKGIGTITYIQADQYNNGVSSLVSMTENLVLNSSLTEYKFSFSLPAAASVPLSTDHTRINFFTSGSVSSIDLYITDVQVELGKVATPFEHRSYGEELALCQRYFQIYGGAATEHFAGGVMATNRLNLIKHFPVTMRAAPSFSATLYGGAWSDWKVYWGSTSANATGTNENYSSISSISIGVLHGGSSTLGGAGYIYANNTNARLSFDAEL